MINIEFAKPASAGFLMPGEKHGLEKPGNPDA